MVQHVNIADADRHEPKGADAATNGQVLKANGDTSTSFVDPSSLITTRYQSVINEVSTSSQNPSGTDTPLQIEFGAGTSNANATLSVAGLLTILTAGVYKISFTGHVGRATGFSDVSDIALSTGDSYTDAAVNSAVNGAISEINDNIANNAVIAIRMLVNDTEVGIVRGCVLGQEIAKYFIEFSEVREFSANDEVKFQIVRDSAGEDDGGLIPISITASGWGDVPSARLKVDKLVGFDYV